MDMRTVLELCGMLQYHCYWYHKALWPQVRMTGMLNSDGLLMSGTATQLCCKLELSIDIRAQTKIGMM
jgi:hypothetical protein